MPVSVVWAYPCFILVAVKWTDAEITVVLYGNADEAGDRILCRFL
jgi:hypothetical protein